MRQEGFNEKYAFELDEVRATKSPSIDEISSNVVLEDQKMDPVPYDDEEFGPMDPSVQLVRGLNSASKFSIRSKQLWTED
ncbi:uncharacterized protein PITG_03212 [Phytophthora infestans T30-4]|uniref:Uncharacterized protein n=1 Tax=Phytophthora infestans (strain T30-4) TaxID=403677 RepID=D0MZN1_PHYIT|nr:uncharacterized protein PITG_03212 [Phytophthora infestans T30-4]EEY65694.1 hypothetical protein PITG_03212 [Phytophthora infestans T30-4]|eukprot:XP_002906293.1 hypothetical protein PITG_03212 [Phytophthora infestans T30-4]